MKATSPDSRVVYHDSSLSAFASGLFVGTLVTLLLATEDGRKAGKKLLSALKEVGQDLEPEIEKFKPQISQAMDSLKDSFTQNMNQPFNPINQLHRTTPPTNSPSFTRAGQPLK